MPAIFKAVSLLRVLSTNAGHRAHSRVGRQAAANHQDRLQGGVNCVRGGILGRLPRFVNDGSPSDELLCHDHTELPITEYVIIHNYYYRLTPACAARVVHLVAYSFDNLRFASSNPARVTSRFFFWQGRFMHMPVNTAVHPVRPHLSGCCACG